MFDEVYDVDISVINKENSEDYLDFTIERRGHGALDIRDRLIDDITNYSKDNGENEYYLEINISNKSDVADYSSTNIESIKSDNVYDVQNMFDLME